LRRALLPLAALLTVMETNPAALLTPQLAGVTTSSAGGTAM
jgi:hypothetical protein